MKAGGRRQGQHEETSREYLLAVRPQREPMLLPELPSKGPVMEAGIEKININMGVY